MIKKIYILLLLSPVFLIGQEKWLTHEKGVYNISYPSNWELNTAGGYGTDLIIFSEIETNDTFRENVNVTIQDVDESISLPKYAELNVGEIKRYVKGAEVFKNILVKNNDRPYIEIIWRGVMDQGPLKFLQFLALRNGKAYIITLTCAENRFDDFEPVGRKILKSFKLK